MCQTLLRGERAKKSNALQELDVQLKETLARWFSLGFMDLQKITWQTPCDIMEKVVTVYLTMFVCFLYCLWLKLAWLEMTPHIGTPCCVHSFVTFFFYQVMNKVDFDPRLEDSGVCM